MTITIELTKEEEGRLQEKAKRAGMEPVGYIRQLIDTAEPPLTLAETLTDFVGVIDGTPGPGDGRAWSHIEAACEPG